MKIDTEKLKQAIKKNTVIHCKEALFAKDLLKELDRLGYAWIDDCSYLDKDNYTMYSNLTCYYPYNGQYCSIEYYEERGYEIVDFEDLLKFYFMVKEV